MVFKYSLMGLGWCRFAFSHRRRGCRCQSCKTFKDHLQNLPRAPPSFVPFGEASTFYAGTIRALIVSRKDLRTSAEARRAEMVDVLSTSEPLRKQLQEPVSGCMSTPMAKQIRARCANRIKITL